MSDADAEKIASIVAEKLRGDDEGDLRINTFLDAPGVGRLPSGEIVNVFIAGQAGSNAKSHCHC